jgi:hypothetical protein
MAHHGARRFFGGRELLIGLRRRVRAVHEDTVAELHRLRQPGCLRGTGELDVDHFRRLPHTTVSQVPDDCGAVLVFVWLSASCKWLTCKAASWASATRRALTTHKRPRKVIYSTAEREHEMPAWGPGVCDAGEGLGGLEDIRVGVDPHHGHWPASPGFGLAVGESVIKC